VNRTVLREQVADKMFFYYAAIILGGSHPVSLTGNNDLGQKMRIRNVTWHRFAEDFAIEGYFRDPYE
jgi:riboflavin biosynthesis pyrimidine reductase